MCALDNYREVVCQLAFPSSCRVPAEKDYRAVCASLVHLLQAERERQGLTKYVVAKRSGLSQQAIGYLERETKKPSLETIVRYAFAIDADLADLIGLAVGVKNAKRRR